MSLYQFLASNEPIKEKLNPYIEHLSVNDMIARGMEVPFNLINHTINPNDKIVLWCDTEDHMDEIQILRQEEMPYPDVEKFTNKPHIATLSWRYTDARAEVLIQYLKEALADAQELELWQIWLADSIDGLKVHEFRINDLTVAVLREHFGNTHFEHPICLRIKL
jgi:hypothetical protein